MCIKRSVEISRFYEFFIFYCQMIQQTNPVLQCCLFATKSVLEKRVMGPWSLKFASNQMAFYFLEASEKISSTVYSFGKFNIHNCHAKLLEHHNLIFELG